MEPVVPRKRSVFGLRDSVLLTTAWLVYWWSSHHHHWPPAETWVVTVLTWFVFFSILGGYKRIVWEMECQKALLRQILTRLEELPEPVATTRYW